jgi:hypothetical protein
MDLPTTVSPSPPIVISMATAYLEGKDKYVPVFNQLSTSLLK